MSDGYEAVQLREVARRGQTSLRTIYRRFPTRDALIVAALEWWMKAHRYAGLNAEALRPEPGDSLHASLMRLYRALFEPWERHPRMLEAYHRARIGPGGDRLIAQGMAAVVPVAEPLTAHTDPDFRRDLGNLLDNLVYALMGRFADGEIEITEFLPTIDRALYWMTTGYEASLSRDASADQAR
ncbi:TetR family transcriptional regulator [Cryptosporangium aurantiacum]